MRHRKWLGHWWFKAVIGSAHPRLLTASRGGFGRPAKNRPRVRLAFNAAFVSGDPRFGSRRRFKAADGRRAGHRRRNLHAKSAGDKGDNFVDRLGVWMGSHIADRSGWSSRTTRSRPLILPLTRYCRTPPASGSVLTIAHMRRARSHPRYGRA